MPRETVRTARHHADLRAGNTDWYRIETRADPQNARGSETHVYIYNEIGYWGITADDFAAELEEITSNRITLHLNSPGGSVFDGVTIFNCLRDHPARVDVMIDGVAASAASFIAMAGDTITMNRGAEMMVHNAHGLCVGNSGDMREMANLLDRQNKKIASIYSERTGVPSEHWLGAMEAESWYDPQEAVAAGLADKAVVDPDADPDDRKTGKAARARNHADVAFDLSVFKHRGRDDAPTPTAYDPDTPADDDDSESDDPDTPPVSQPADPDEAVREDQDNLARLRAFKQSHERVSTP